MVPLVTSSRCHSYLSTKMIVHEAMGYQRDRKGQSVLGYPHMTKKRFRQVLIGKGAKNRSCGIRELRGRERVGTICFLVVWLLCCITKGSVAAQRLEDSSGIDDADSQLGSTVTGNSLPFDRGGSRPRCWNATAEFSDGIFPAEAVTFQDCAETTHLKVEVQSTSHVRRTPQGWQVAQNEPLTIALQGTFTSSSSAMVAAVKDGSSLAVLVMQLCPVGFQSRCTPLVPPRPDVVPTSTGTTTTIITEQGTKDQSQTGGLVTLEYTSILPNGTFMGQSSLTDTPPGIYSLLGSLIVFGNDTPGLEGVSMVPIASGNEQVFTIYYPADVSTDSIEVPVTVEQWAVHIVISLCVLGGCVVLALVIGAFVYRKTQVFTLSQGKFIIAMLLSGLVATTSLVLLEPKNDLYCHLYQPFITLPMHIMFAILVGRMWRIRAIISPLLLLTMEKKEHWTTKWVNMVERITRMECLSESVKPREKKIRISITDGQLIRVIGLFCAPQVTVQVLIFAMEDQFLVTRQLESSSVEYETCNNTYFNNTLGILALTFLVLQFVVLILLAGASRDLPSLFNETRSLLDVAVVAFRMMFIGGLILLGTHTYPSGVTAQYLVLAVLAGVTIVHTCIRITWPKFTVAKSGSKIVVTKLIAAHNEMRTRAHSAASSGVLLPLDPYNRNNAYGGSMMTGILIPRTYDQAAIFSSLTGHSSAPKLTIDSQATPRSSDGAYAGNLETLREEDDRESSDNSQGGINRNIHQNDGNERAKGDRVGGDDDDDLQSTASSVIIIEETNETPKVTRYQSLYSSSMMERKRHNRSSPSQTGIISQDIAGNLSLSFARTHSEASMPGEIAFKNTRVLSRRALLHGSSSTTQVMTDVENRPQDQSLQESTIIPPTDSPSQAGSKGEENRIVRRPARNRGSKERISNAGHRMLSLISGNGSVVKSDFSRRSTSSSDRIKPMIPLTIEYNPKRISDTIIVAEYEPPPRRLLLRMIDVQRMLAKVNQAILTGLSVSPEDWEEIRDACVALGDVFVREVDFDWERFHEDDGFQNSGEFTLNDLHPPDSVQALHPNSQNLLHGQSEERGMAKQISWKPGLIGSPPQAPLDASPTRPSILRGRDYHAKSSEITSHDTRPIEAIGD